MTLRIPDYPDAQLRAMVPADRHELWKKARSMSVSIPEALTLAERIEVLGLPYSDPKYLRLDDPLTIRIYEIVFSAEARKAGLEAAEAGAPALAGIDPILTRELGHEYGAHSLSTLTAGAFVAEMMRTAGFEKTGKQGKLPSGCRAKTAALFAQADTVAKTGSEPAPKSVPKSASKSKSASKAVSKPSARAH